MNLPPQFARTVSLRESRAFVTIGETVVHVTLLGERQAAVGHEFVYRGPQPECGPCRVKTVCLNQEPGLRYRVSAVRDVNHPCLLNEERARVVEVELAPPPCSLSVRAGVEGALVSYEGVVCANGRCPNFRTCHPIGLERGVRLKVLEVGPELDCPLGYELVPARVAYSERSAR
jgi:uncharacterized protein